MHLGTYGKKEAGDTKWHASMTSRACARRKEGAYCSLPRHWTTFALCAKRTAICLGQGADTSRRCAVAVAGEWDERRKLQLTLHLQKKVIRNKKGVGRKNGSWVLSGAIDEGTCYVDAETDADSVLFSPSNKRSQYSRESRR